MPFAKKKTGQLILILDVQSCVIRGSLVYYAPNSAPKFIFTYNEGITYKPNTDSSYLIKTTLKCVSKAIEAAVGYVRSNASTFGDMPTKISAVHYALSSPWIVSQAKVLNFAYPENIHVTKSYVLGLIEEERAKLNKAPSSPATVIEEKIFDVRLNGYSVHNWENRDAKELELAFTVSISATSIVDNLIEQCLHVVKKKDVIFHSSLLLQHIGIQQLFPKEESYLLIHIHGELTDCAIIHNRACTLFGSFPYGVRTLVRRLAAANHGEESAAESLLTLYSGNQMDKDHASLQIQTLEHISEDWANDLKKLFEASSSRIVMPDRIIMSAWGFDDYYVKVLTKAYPGSTIRLVTVDDISAGLAYADKAERRRLNGLYAIAIKDML